MNALNLKQYEHPKKEHQIQYDQLVGLDEHKTSLLTTLELLLKEEKLSQWLIKHHKKGFQLADQLVKGTPLIILSGDVGCGKTALAQSIATPLAVQLKERKIVVFETPSNIRGSGMVGEISNRITETFEQVKRKLGKENIGLLIIDEADDIATSRAQNQAHHEDRAGLNVLIKQIDTIARDNVKLAVILITNRVNALDPAIRRRAALQLNFERPKGKQLREVLTFIFDGIKYNKKSFERIFEILNDASITYSYSDLIQRVAKQAIYAAINENQPFSLELFEVALNQVMPSPMIEEAVIVS